VEKERPFASEKNPSINRRSLENASVTDFPFLFGRFGCLSRPEEAAFAAGD
jgi:hypothetical protein